MAEKSLECNASHLTLTFPLPSIEEQQAFVKFAEQVDKSKFLLIKARKVFVDTNNTKMRFDYFTIIVIIGLGKETKIVCPRLRKS